MSNATYKEVSALKSYACQTCGKFVSSENYYGSGRFCSAKCAHSFSGTCAANSKEAQAKKSNSLRKWHQEHPKPKRPKIKSKSKRKTYVLDTTKILELHQKYNLYDISCILQLPTKKLYSWAKENNILDTNFVNHRSTQIISACRNALSKDFKDGSITTSEYEYIRNECIRLMNEENLNPRQVCSEYLKLDKSYHQFLSLCMHIPLKSFSEAQKTYHKRIGTYDNMSEKEKYYIQCIFRFPHTLLKHIPGYDSLLNYGWYNPITNLNGVAKDHMISKLYGWTHHIDPYLISHPANCMLLTQQENASKSSKCSLTLNELIERVEWFNNTFI